MFLSSIWCLTCPSLVRYAADPNIVFMSSSMHRVLWILSNKRPFRPWKRGPRSRTTATRGWSSLNSAKNSRGTPSCLPSLCCIRWSSIWYTTPSSSWPGSQVTFPWNSAHAFQARRSTFMQLGMLISAPLLSRSRIRKMACSTVPSTALQRCSTWSDRIGSQKQWPLPKLTSASRLQGLGSIAMRARRMPCPMISSSAASHAALAEPEAPPSSM
mmetsp:Transcript_78818/g.231294  ORF Transcript_78818/g.231294 Transcript_78818/m.231294 type:complete len:214 (+) Transcript_78818:1432-2073(+)